MAKMNKEQTAKFNSLFEDTLNWGDGSTCTGLFDCLGGPNLGYLATEVDGDDLQIFEFTGSYWEFLGSMPINSKTKAKFKKIVLHLMDKDFDTLEF
ncbi:hypothetical protein AP1_0022 [Aeromonas phage AP1]|nr:hypothetical protein AP1_0022 [Aeromonas phage AP1]